MKLDLNGITATQQINKSTKASVTSAKDQQATPVATNPSPADRTTFQSGPTSVAALVSKAMATPEIRQDKIDSIRQSISNGTFKFDAGKVADAMIADSESSYKS